MIRIWPKYTYLMFVEHRHCEMLERGAPHKCCPHIISWKKKKKKKICWIYQLIYKFHLQYSHSRSVIEFIYCDYIPFSRAKLNFLEIKANNLIIIMISKFHLIINKIIWIIHISSGRSLFFVRKSESMTRNIFLLSHHKFYYLHL